MDKKYIDRGATGVCYELSNGNVLKIFNKPKKISNLEKYKSFLDYKNHTVIFPHEFITSLSKFKGHISIRAEGVKLNSEDFKGYKINDMYKGLVVLEKDIEYVSNGGIKMIDNHSGNMFYDGKKFSVIDVDSYYISEGLKDKVLYKNQIRINEIFYEIFCDYIDFDIKNRDKVKSLLRKHIFWDLNVVETLYQFKSIIEEYYGNTIETISDIKKIIK